MYLILVIGHTGQGKTSFVKKSIEGKNQYVFDVNNEFQHLPDDRILSPRMRHRDLDTKKFLFNVAAVKNSNIVFEDATGFFRGRQSPLLIKEIVKKRHSGNNFFILFHSINRVPPELFELCNFIVLFKTNDNLEQVQMKFKNEMLTSAFKRVRTYPLYKPEIIKMI